MIGLSYLIWSASAWSRQLAKMRAVPGNELSSKWRFGGAGATGATSFYLESATGYQLLVKHPWQRTVNHAARNGFC